MKYSGDMVQKKDERKMKETWPPSAAIRIVHDRPNNLDASGGTRNFAAILS